MLEQTKRAINTLKEAGLKRCDFRVRVTRTYFCNASTNYRRYFEYGPLRITLLNRLNPEIVDIKKIVDAGYDVTQYVGFDEDRMKNTFDIRQGGRCGKFQVEDFHIGKLPATNQTCNLYIV